MGDLRSAVEQNQLVLYYQPKVNMQTGRVSGVEALVRWQHPQHGLMYPDDFIPLAEQAGLIRQVTLWVLEKALAQHTDWLQMGIDLSMAVNLSARNLQDNVFPDEVGTLLRGYHHTQLSRLRFEITETAMMADPAAPRRYSTPSAPWVSGCRSMISAPAIPPGVPQAIAGGGIEDRQILRDGHGQRRQRRGNRAFHHRPRP